MAAPFPALFCRSVQALLASHITLLGPLPASLIREGQLSDHFFSSPTDQVKNAAPLGKAKPTPSPCFAGRKGRPSSQTRHSPPQLTLLPFSADSGGQARWAPMSFPPAQVEHLRATRVP